MAEMRVPPHLFPRNGKWYVKKVIRGERFRASTGIPLGGERELKRAMIEQAKILAEWDKQADVARRPKEIPTFGEWWQIYFSTYSAKNANPQMDAYLVRGALEKWQRIRLNHIQKSMCENHLNSRGREVSQGTVNRERSLLQAVFQRAIDDNFIEQNPFRKIKRIADAIRTRILSLEEQHLLMAVLSPQFQRWLVVMLGTGLRFSECRAVLPGHLDRAARLLHVQAYAAKGGKARSIPLFSEVETAIDAQWASKGKLWPQKSLPERLTAAAELAGIPHIHPHALRHTFATRYLKAGGNLMYLSRILGHANVLITQKQYVHESPADMVANSRGLDLGLTTNLGV